MLRYTVLACLVINCRVYMELSFPLSQMFKPFLTFSLAWHFLMYSQQQHNSVCHFPTHFFKTHLNIILPSMTRTSKFSLSFRFTYQTLYAYLFCPMLLHAHVWSFTWFWLRKETTKLSSRIKVIFATLYIGHFEERTLNYFKSSGGS
jgi:hypothetical protein